MTRSFVAFVPVLVFSLCSLPASAQLRAAFESLDSDANGQISIDEYAKLSGPQATPEGFGALDRDFSGVVSREEWVYGLPDASGRRGIAKEAAARGARRGTPPSFLGHGRSVPRQNTDEVDLERLPPKPRDQWPALTGRAGVDGQKRRVPSGPPPVHPDQPPQENVPPRRSR